MEQLLHTLLEFPLVAQPGTLWHYSIATDICGYLVELISDMPFADYLQQVIFDPLGMVDTAFEVSADKIDRFATLYGYREDDPLAQLEHNDSSPFISAISGVPVRLHSGGGGLTSTAGDYWRFAQMMLNRGQLEGQRIVKTETVDLMTRNHLPEDLLPLDFNCCRWISTGSPGAISAAMASVWATASTWIQTIPRRRARVATSAGAAWPTPIAGSIPRNNWWQS
jgi:CubicO group peptidase (beta-lactamase class C family)